MPKISGDTTASIEQKDGVMTSDFTLGRQDKVKPVVFSQKQTEQIMSVLGFRAAAAIRLQEQEDKIPSEMDQAAAEIFKLIKENGSLEGLNKQQLAIAYFSLREIGETSNHEYYKWAIEGKRKKRFLGLGLKSETKSKAEYKKEEIELIQNTVADLERSLTGAPLRRWRKQTSAEQERQRLILNHIYEKHKTGDTYKGTAIELAAADFARLEIQKILGKRGELDQNRIAAAEQSTNFAERIFGRTAQKIPELIEKAGKDRREIRAWTGADNIRRFLGAGITSAELTDMEIITAIAKNNPDIESPTNLTAISNFTEQGKKTKVDYLIKTLVQKHSFNTVIDTAISIIDQKLPAETEPAVQAPETKLGRETAAKFGADEIALLLAEGKTEAELLGMGVNADLIKQTKRRFCYQNEQGLLLIKEAEDDENAITQEKTQLLGEYESRIEPEKIAGKTDELLEKQAEAELQSLGRGAEITPVNNETYEPYEAELVKTANNLINAVNNARNTNIPNVSSLTDIEHSQYHQLMAFAKKEWITKRALLLKQNYTSRNSVKLVAVEAIIQETPDLTDQYYGSLSNIKTSELRQLKPETLAILKSKGKISAESWDKLTTAGLAQPNIMQDGGQLKPPEQIAQALTQKSTAEFPLTSWASLIFLGIISLNQAVSALSAANKAADSQQLEQIFSA